MRGECYGALRQYDKAIADLSKAIELKPDSAAHWNRRGNWDLALRQYDKALADYSKAIELEPENPLPKNDLAWVLATCPDAKFRNAARAVELAKKAVDKKPKNGGYWNTLGVAHYRAGDWKAGIHALEKSMELRKGGGSEDWFFLAMAHWQLGRKDKARNYYDKAVEWMDKNKPKDEELGRFRAETAGLLGISEQKSPSKSLSNNGQKP